MSSLHFLSGLGFVWVFFVLVCLGFFINLLLLYIKSVIKISLSFVCHMAAHGQENNITVSIFPK